MMARIALNVVKLLVIALILGALPLMSDRAQADPSYYYVVTKVRAKVGETWYNFKPTEAAGTAWRLIALTADWPLVVTLEVTWERFGTNAKKYGPEFLPGTQAYLDGVPKGWAYAIDANQQPALRKEFYYFPKSGTHEVYLGYNNFAGVTGEAFPAKVKIVPRFKLNL